jgi:CHAT domain-containing protein
MGDLNTSPAVGHGDNANLITDYLLGRLPDDERNKVEERLLTDLEFYDRVALEEDALVEQYVFGELTEGERTAFESTFLMTPEGRQQVDLARALKRKAANRSSKPGLESAPPPWQRLHRRPAIRVAAAVVVAAAIALALWRLVLYSPGVDNSDIEAAITSLKRAFPLRPVESRLSGFQWTPLSDPRGGWENRIDRVELDRADHLLARLDSDQLGPRGHQARGQVYLYKGELALAIEELTRAADADPLNPLLHNDLGVALLEQARKGQSPSAQPCEEFNKALKIDSSLKEAVFNRALCLEIVGDARGAAQAWDEYIRLDPDSEWADEANAHRERLDKGRSRLRKDRLFEEFLAGFELGDDNRAWDAFKLLRSRDGNFATDKLIASYLDAARVGNADDAADELRALTYAGRLEEINSGDRFTLDLARYYTRSGARVRETLEEARRLTRLGWARFLDSEFDEGAAEHSRAGELFRKAGDECEASLADMWRGICYLRIPDNSRSIPVFERLRNVAKLRRYRSLLGHSLLGLADAQVTAGEISAALRLSEQAREIGELAGDDEVLLRCRQSSIGRAVDVEKNELALSSCFQALIHAQRVPENHRVIWNFYFRAAQCLSQIGCPYTALDFGNEALEIAREAGWSFIASRSYAGLSPLYLKLADKQAAIESVRLALKEADGIRGEKARLNTTANSTLQLADLYRETGELKDSVALYDKVLHDYAKLGFQIYSLRAHAGKMAALIAQGNRAGAQAETETALRLLEGYRERIQEDSGRVSFFHAAQTVTDRAVDFTYGQNREKALMIADSAHARSLLDLMRGANVAEVGGSLDVVAELSQSPMTLSQVRTLLPDNVQLVEYSVLPKRLLIWVISRGTELQSVEQPVSQEDLVAKVRRYHKLLSEPRKDGIETTSLAKELYQILIEPLMPYLAEDCALYIVPDKILNYVPFAALRSGSERWLIEDRAIGISPSAAVFARSTEEARLRNAPAGERLLAVGNPAFDRAEFEEFQDLPDAAWEGREVSALFRDRKDDAVLTGIDASEDRVKAEMARSDVIHFACHYKVDDRSWMRSGLVLAAPGTGQRTTTAGDGILRAAEIYDLRLNRTRLAVVSACSTGLERAYSGEGAISIARPFLAAGVPVVVGTLWPVDSRASAELMTRFHQKRKQGQSTVIALRNAQREMLGSERSLRADPHNWAGFTVMGGHSKY